MKKKTFLIVSLDSVDCSLNSELYSEFQVNIFSNNRYYKMSKFLHHDDHHNDDAKAIAIPRGFSENSRAKNDTYGFCARCNLKLFLEPSRRDYMRTLSQAAHLFNPYLAVRCHKLILRRL